jgi:tetratricopeptide (TPR) repeat protein
VGGVEYKSIKGKSNRILWYARVGKEKISFMNIKSILFILTMMLCFRCEAMKKSILDFKYGKYQVGFKNFYIEDSATKYPIQINGTDTVWQSKPLVIAVWFPTHDSTDIGNKYVDYLKFKNHPKNWVQFISRLQSFNSDWIKESCFGKIKTKEDSLKINPIFNALLAQEVKANFNAEFIRNEKFPLIVYQQCLGGTIEENALLFEYLSSYGYIIVCGSNQNNKGKTLHPDWNLKRSAKDMNCLLDFALANLPIDKNATSLMGFSFGAQSNLSLLASNFGNFKDAIFLDSQIEYANSFETKQFSTIITDAIANSSNIKIPLMFITGHNGSNIIPDTLLNASRYYVSLNEISHYSFTSQYNAVKMLMDSTKLKSEVDLYMNTCSIILQFLNHHSLNTSFSLKFKEKEYSNIYIEHIPIGFSGKNWNLESLKKPRYNLQTIFRNYGVEKSMKYCKKHHLVIKENDLNNLAYSYKNKKEFENAKKIFEWNIRLYPLSSNTYDGMGEYYFESKEYEKAKTNFKKAVELNPANENSLKYLVKINSLPQ